MAEAFPPGLSLVRPSQRMSAIRPTRIHTRNAGSSFSCKVIISLYLSPLPSISHVTLLFVVRAYAALTMPGGAEHWNLENFKKELDKLKAKHPEISDDFPFGSAQPQTNVGEEQNQELQQTTEEEQQRQEQEELERQETEKKKHAEKKAREEEEKETKRREEEKKKNEDEIAKKIAEEKKEEEISKKAVEEKNRLEEESKRKHHEDIAKQAQVQQAEQERLQRERVELAESSRAVQAAASQVVQIAERQNEVKRIEVEEMLAAAERRRKEHEEEKMQLEQEEKELAEARKQSMEEHKENEAREKKRREELTVAYEKSVENQQRLIQMSAPTSTSQVMPVTPLPAGMTKLKFTYSLIDFVMYDPDEYGKKVFSEILRVSGVDQDGGNYDRTLRIMDIVKIYSESTLYICLGFVAQPGLGPASNNIVKAHLVRLPSTFQQGSDRIPVTCDTVFNNDKDSPLVRRACKKMHILQDLRVVDGVHHVVRLRSGTADAPTLLHDLVVQKKDMFVAGLRQRHAEEKLKLERVHQKSQKSKVALQDRADQKAEATVLAKYRKDIKKLTDQAAAVSKNHKAELVALSKTHKKEVVSLTK